jgi:hypothetical protein
MINKKLFADSTIHNKELKSKLIIFYSNISKNIIY